MLESPPQPRPSARVHTPKNHAAVVTGLGATTPLGATMPETWNALLAGHSGIRHLSQSWAADLPVRIAAPVMTNLRDRLSHKELRTLDRSAQLALAATREAWDDAGLTGPASAGGDLAPHRVATIIGCGMGGLATALEQQKVLDERGPRFVSPHGVPMLMPNSAAAWAGMEVGALAGAHAPTSACASGAEAVVRAHELITSGQVDIVVTGGTEAIITPLTLCAFHAARALSTTSDPEAASRPWDRSRNGFVLAEGAAVLIIESVAHAHARGARVLAELPGAAMTSDSYHITRPQPHGSEMARAITLALDRAGLAPEDVCHWNAHATSTPVGDATELRAVRLALGKTVVDSVAASATKSSTGHLIGAAGALEAALTVLALRHSIAPPTLNLDRPDDDSPANAVRVAPRPLSVAEGCAALSTSLGFGGANAAIVLRRAETDGTEMRSGRRASSGAFTTPI